MSKSKHAKPDEHLLGELRALRSENRNLKKRIKQLEKYQNIVTDESEEPEDIDLCPQCGKGELKEIAFPTRSLKVCQNANCDYRTKTKKL